MAVTVEKLGSTIFVDHDVYTGATSSAAVAWRDMRDFRNLLVTICPASLAGTGVTAFSIKAAPAASATNAQTIVSHAVGSAPDAVGDILVLECSAEQIAQIGAAAGYELRYVGVYLTVNNSSDINVVTWIFGGARNPQTGLTDDIVSS